MKPYTTDVLTDAQILFIAQQLPSPKATTGRPAYSNQELLPGIVRVLRSGCLWRDLNLPGYPDGSTHWRRLRLWRKGLHFRRLWRRILKLLGEQNPAEQAMRLKRFSIDGTLLQSFEFQDRTGYSGKHRRVGVKASVVVDATGLPVSAVLASGNAHDLSLAEESVSRLRGYDYFQVPPDLVVKSQGVDIAEIILSLMRRSNVVQTLFRNRKSRIKLFSLSEDHWSTTKSDGM